MATVTYQSPASIAGNAALGNASSAPQGSAGSPFPASGGASSGSAPLTARVGSVNGQVAPDIAPGYTFPGQISASGLSQNVTPINIPSQSLAPVTSLATTNSATPATGYTLDSTTGLYTPNAPANSGFDANLKGRLDALTGIYNNKKSSEQIAQESGLGAVESAQADVNKYTGQINTIVAKSQADQLSTIGQGRGIPEAIIGGQQAQIAREAAIQALPLQALLANAQGNKELAQQHFDTFFKVKMQDEQSKFDFQTNLINTVYDYADKQEQRRLDTLQHQADQNFTANQNALNFKQGLISEALKIGDTKTVTALTALSEPDQNSKTYKQDKVNYDASVSKVLSTAKQNPLFNLQVENAQLTNAKLRKETELLGEPTAAEKKAAAAALANAQASIPAMQDKIIAIDALKESPGLSSRVGSSLFSRTPTGFVSGALKTGAAILGPGAPSLVGDIGASTSGAGQAFAGGVHQLTNGLTLQNLIDAKAQGATFGALSDAELNLLASSATRLNDWEIKDNSGVGKGVWNIDEATFVKELDTIKTLTNRALILSQGTLLKPEEESTIDNLYTKNTSTLPAANYY